MWILWTIHWTRFIYSKTKRINFINLIEISFNILRTYFTSHWHAKIKIFIHLCWKSLVLNLQHLTWKSGIHEVSTTSDMVLNFSWSGTLIFLVAYYLFNFNSVLWVFSKCTKIAWVLCNIITLQIWYSRLFISFIRQWYSTILFLIFAVWISCCHLRNIFIVILARMSILNSILQCLLAWVFIKWRFRIIQNFIPITFVFLSIILSVEHSSCIAPSSCLQFRVVISVRLIKCGIE